MLDPTAFVDPSAQLGENCTVGPFAVIEAGAQVGDDCTIQAHAVVTGHVSMGRGNFVGYGAVIGGDPQDLGFAPETPSEVRIGDGNRIREHCTIHRGSSAGAATILGDRCFLMAGAHLGHDARVGNDVIIANHVLLGGHVQVEDRVFIGGGSVFHQHTRVGRLAICQGLSGYSKDVPPFTIGARINGVAGLNVIGLRRAGLSPGDRGEIKEAFALVYQRGLNVAQALAAGGERAWGAEATAFFTFVAAAKKRGICDFIPSRRGAPGEAAG